MKEDLRKEFEELSKPLNEWLQKNFSPHHKVVVSFDGAEVVSGEMGEAAYYVAVVVALCLVMVVGLNWYLYLCKKRQGN